MTFNTDVHFSSGIGNKAFCHAAKRLSGEGIDGEASVDGVRRAAAIWYTANQSYWTGFTTFGGACAGLVSAAEALDYTPEEVELIRTSFADVGVTCEGGGGF